MSSERTEGDNQIQSPVVTSSSDPHDIPATDNTSSNSIGFRVRCRRPIRRLTLADEHQEHLYAQNPFNNPHVIPQRHDGLRNIQHGVENLNNNYHVCNRHEGEEHQHYVCDHCRNHQNHSFVDQNIPRNVEEQPVNQFDNQAFFWPPFENPSGHPDNVQEPNEPLIDYPEPFFNGINFEEPIQPNEPLIDYPEPFFNGINFEEPIQDPYHSPLNLFNPHVALIAPQESVNPEFPINHLLVENAFVPILNNGSPCRTNNVENMSTRFATLSVILIFMTSLLGLYLVYQTFPEVTDDEVKHLKVPWNIEDAKNLGIVLNRYKGDHYYHVMAGVFLTYIFLQTFAIPGSLFLSILSGFLFPFYTALVLVCTCSMLGATLCFMLSQLLGRKLVLKHFPGRAAKWALQVEKHKDNLFNYMVFLRITPILPNWFINLTAPVIGVPLIPFAFGTFLGVAPPSFFAIQGGQTLLAMTADHSAFNMQTLGWLGVFAIVSIIPIFLRHKV